MSIKIALERLSVMWVWRKSDEKYHKDYVKPRKRSIDGMMEDGASVHKDVCKDAHKMLKWPQYCHPPNSPDLNPIENIWAWMKHQIARRYKYITSQKEMRRIVLKIWTEFKDTQ